jgi:flagellar motor switch protein FliN/FliY
VPTDLQTILKLSVPVIVQIGQRKLPLDDVLALGPGAILELGKSSEDDLELLVNNKPIGTGSAVKVGENFGIRIGFVGDAKQRIAALAGAQT